MHMITQGSTRIILLLLVLSSLFGSCTSARVSLSKNPHIKNLKYYAYVKVNKWNDTQIKLTGGEAVVITPQYPLGFIDSVKGNVGDTETVEALDIDFGEIHIVRTNGTLRLGLDGKHNPIKTGVFVFNNHNLDEIVSDLLYISRNDKDPQIIDLTLGILFMQQSDKLLLSNRLEEALITIDKAIERFKAVDDRVYSTTISRLYRKKGDLYKAKNDYERFSESVSASFEFLMKTAENYKYLNDRKYSFLSTLNKEEQYILLSKTLFFQKSSMPYNPKWGHRFSNLAFAYACIGLYYSEIGNLKLSLKYCFKALEEAKKGDNGNLIAQTYLMLARRHLNFSFFVDAKSELLNAAKYCDNDAEWLKYAIDYGLASADCYLNNLASAEDILKALWKKTPPNAHTRPMTLTFLNARLYYQAGQFQNALPLLEKTYGNFKSVSGTSELVDRTMHIKVGFMIIRSLSNMGKTLEAQNYIQIIESDIEDIGNPIKLRLELILIKAELLDQAGGDSIPSLLEAVDYLERIRPTANLSQDYEYWESMLSIYNKLVTSLFEKGDIEQALDITEKARSRRFLDSLGNKRLGAKELQTKWLSRQATESLEALAILESDIIQAASETGIKLRSIFSEDSRYSKRLNKACENIKKIGAEDEHFNEIYNVETILYKNIKQMIAPHTTIIDYFLSKDDIYIWVIDQNAVAAVKVQASQSRLNELIADFRKHLSTDMVQRGLKVTDLPGSDNLIQTRELYDILIAPVEKYIKYDKISIIPYGALNYLPFQALSEGKKYLVEKHTISYIPSLSMLKFFGKGAVKKNYRILAFGNPDLGEKAYSLPAAEKEVELIRSLFPAAQIFKGQAASEDKLKKYCDQFDIIHFACHGEYNRDDSLSSCIFLSPHDNEDGLLEAREIFDLNMPTDIVVVSACQTAMGTLLKGDEIIGLSRAFLYAGATSVLGSLWNISDEATFELMKVFYANIGKMSKPEALRKAQIHMIRSKNYAHPYLWASFNLIGNY